jgi:hypothetical protein
MALEFAGKNVLIVDGNPFHHHRVIESYSSCIRRFHCSRHNIEGNYSNGKGRRREKGYCGELFASNTVSWASLGPEMITDLM